MELKHDKSLYASSDGFSPVKPEHNDCSVRAFAVAACVSYSDSHALFAKYGRRYAHKTYPKTLRGVMAEAFPNVKPVETRQTLARFVAEHPSGHYYIQVSGHALAVVDGVVHDWFPKGRRFVRRFWRLA